MRIALLIVDVQKEFMADEKYRRMLLDAAEYINEVSGYFRDAGQPVVIVQDLEAGDGPGSKGFEVADEIDTAPSDIVIRKMYGNSFWKTDLEQKLKDLDVQHVIVSGFSAAHCVLATYNGATERGFDVSMLQNGIAGLTQQQTDAAHLDRNVINYRAVRLILDLVSAAQ